MGTGVACCFFGKKKSASEKLIECNKDQSIVEDFNEGREEIVVVLEGKAKKFDDSRDSSHLVKPETTNSQMGEKKSYETTTDINAGETWVAHFPSDSEKKVEETRTFVKVDIRPEISEDLKLEEHNKILVSREDTPILHKGETHVHNGNSARKFIELEAMKLIEPKSTSPLVEEVGIDEQLLSNSKKKDDEETPIIIVDNESKIAEEVEVSKQKFSVSEEANSQFQVQCEGETHIVLNENSAAAIHVLVVNKLVNLESLSSETKENKVKKKDEEEHIVVVAPREVQEDKALVEKKECKVSVDSKDMLSEKEQENQVQVEIEENKALATAHSDEALDPHSPINLVKKEEEKPGKIDGQKEVEPVDISKENNETRLSNEEINEDSTNFIIIDLVKEGNLKIKNEDIANQAAEREGFKENKENEEERAQNEASLDPVKEENVEENTKNYIPRQVEERGSLEEKKENDDLNEKAQHEASSELAKESNAEDNTMNDMANHIEDKGDLKEKKEDEAKVDLKENTENEEILEPVKEANLEEKTEILEEKTKIEIANHAEERENLEEKRETEGNEDLKANPAKEREDLKDTKETEANVKKGIEENAEERGNLEEKRETEAKLDLKENTENGACTDPMKKADVEEKAENENVNHVEETMDLKQPIPIEAKVESSTENEAYPVVQEVKQLQPKTK